MTTINGIIQIWRHAKKCSYIHAHVPFMVNIKSGVHTAHFSLRICTAIYFQLRSKIPWREDQDRLNSLVPKL